MQDARAECDRVAKWMKDYADRYGIKGFVVGMSGGIDSSLIACLAKDAVGKDSVMGLVVPCDSREDMAKDAKELIKRLMLANSNSVDIYEVFDAFVEVLKRSIGELDRIVLANLKARLRMAAIYAVANKYNYLVAGTGNLSELAIGYVTKHGDGAVDIEPVGNYYKHEIYAMAKMYEDVIPENVFKKKPSADLWTDQTDEGEIGMTYPELDVVLDVILNQRFGQLLDIPKGRVERVAQLMRGAGHKNNPPQRCPRDGS